MDLSLIVLVAQGVSAQPNALHQVTKHLLPESELLLVESASSTTGVESHRGPARDGKCTCNRVSVHGPWNDALARQRGLEAAAGRYVIFVDYRDGIAPGALNAMVSLADSHAADMVVTCASHGAWSFDTIGPDAHSGELRQATIQGMELFDAWITQKGPTWSLGWNNRLYRRRLLMGSGSTLGVVDFADGLACIAPALSARNCVLVNTELFKTNRRPTALGRNDAALQSPAFHDHGYLALRAALHYTGLTERYRDTAIRLFLDQSLSMTSGENLRLRLQSAASQDEAWGEVLAYARARNVMPQHVMRVPATRTVRTVKPLCSGNQVGRPQPTPVFRRTWSGNRPLVTVATVTRNILAAGRREYFQTMLDSVKRQTIGRACIEHMVVDGASNDGTVSWLEDLFRNADIDVLVSEPDTGIYEAMNRASMHAHGQYLLYLNSDDYLLPHALEKLLNAIVSTNGDYAFADAEKIDEEGRITGTSVADIDKIFFGTPYCHQTVLCKRSCFEDAYFDESYRITMWSQALKLFMLGYRHAHVREPLACFRIGGLSSGADTAAELQRERELIKVTTLMPRLGIAPGEYACMDRLRRSRKAELEPRMVATCRRLATSEDWFARAFLRSFERLRRPPKRR